jgi:hypothetical protein
MRVGSYGFYENIGLRMVCLCKVVTRNFERFFLTPASGITAQSGSLALRDIHKRLLILI